MTIGNLKKSVWAQSPLVNVDDKYPVVGESSNNDTEHWNALNSFR